ncbi:MAG: DNA-packaging protein [Proteobacteria bacterium]|nr:DNA-packaging protein [Pseudomonadota bacterium]
MTPENASLAESLASLPASERKTLIAELSEADARGLIYDWRFWARPKQLAPPESGAGGDWTTWLVLAGRGFGKTRCGAEWVRAQVCGTTPLARGQARRVALVAETAADARDVMIEGESGLLAVHPPEFRPLYQPSKRRLVWPNGARATLYNAIEPDQLRGPQHDLAWADELAKWRHAEATWDQLQFGLRLGARPRQCVTTTPRPIKTLKSLIEDPDTVITRGTSYENMANLAPAFIKRIIKRYEGTRLGRQELNAELLDDVPGALWTRARIDALRVAKAPELVRVVVAVDPAAGSGDRSAETGIVVAGLGADGHGYVLDDASLRATPDAWGRAAVSAYRRWQADRIIGEVNHGGEMIEHVIRTVDENVSYKAVRASRGKARRAEPVAALDEQGKVHHVGAFPELEDQMCAMTADFERGAAGFSPDRVDARVWALTELMLGAAPGEPRLRAL